jgi:hypothetical protein
MKRKEGERLNGTGVTKGWRKQTIREIAEVRNSQWKDTVKTNKYMY